MAVPRGGEYHSLAVQAAKYAPELKTVEGFFAGLDQLPPGVLPHGATAALEAVCDAGTFSVSVSVWCLLACSSKPMAARPL